MMLSRAAVVGRLQGVRLPAIPLRCSLAPAFISSITPALVSTLRFVTRATSGKHPGLPGDSTASSSSSSSSSSAASFSTAAGSSSSASDGEDDDESHESEEVEEEQPLKPQRASKWMIVGLGNPGSKFIGTRHNVGFEAVDLLAQQENIKLNTIQCKALVGKGLIHGVPVLLVKPQTYMNLSGDAVSPLALYYKVKPHNILVVLDDMNLEVATMKLNPKGGAGGQNGMKHIIQRFKDNQQIPRLRIGIGRPPGSMDPKAYVLQKFTPRERVEIDVCYERAADAVRMIAAEGFEATLSKWNPPKRSRDPTNIKIQRATSPTTSASPE